jgi:protein PET100, fungi type
MYIMFPIAWMYYFGTNLENRFSVPDFWPKPEETYKIPFEKQEIHSELERLRHRRLDRRARRLEEEGKAEEAAVAAKEADQALKRFISSNASTTSISAAVDGKGKSGSWWSGLFGNSTGNNPKNGD